MERISAASLIPAITVWHKKLNMLRYAGEYWDEETGLQYLRSRWYDPNLGRFINEDTYEGDKAEPDSLNLYTYVENNPLIYTDPSGEAKRGEKNALEGLGSGSGSASGSAGMGRSSGGGFGGGGGGFRGGSSGSKPKSSTSSSGQTSQGIGNIKFSPNNLPKDPKELVKNGWKDVTPEGMVKNTSSREYFDPKTGMKVRFDPGKPGANGFEGKDHYHVTNPKGTSKADYYLDVKGNPVAKGSKASHIVP